MRADVDVMMLCNAHAAQCVSDTVYIPGEAVGDEAQMDVHAKAAVPGNECSSLYVVLCLWRHNEKCGNINIVQRSRRMMVT